MENKLKIKVVIAAIVLFFLGSLFTLSVSGMDNDNTARISELQAQKKLVESKIAIDTPYCKAIEGLQDQLRGITKELESFQQPSTQK